MQARLPLRDHPATRSRGMSMSQCRRMASETTLHRNQSALVELRTPAFQWRLHSPVGQTICFSDRPEPEPRIPPAASTTAEHGMRSQLLRGYTAKYSKASIDRTEALQPSRAKYRRLK